MFVIFKYHKQEMPHMVLVASYLYTMSNHISICALIFKIQICLAEAFWLSWLRQQILECKRELPR